jgi:proline dehydrogenase
METVGSQDRVEASGDLEATVLQRGRELVAAEPRRSPLRALDDAVTRRISSRPAMRSAFYRMVDVAPVCSSPRELGAHFVAYLRSGPAPGPLGASALGLGLALANRVAGRRFIVASSPDRAMPYVRGLWGRGIGATLDLLGEAVVRAGEADDYAGRCIDALGVLGREAAAAGAPPDGDPPRADLSVKPSALTAEIRPWAPWSATEDAAMRLRAILRRAQVVGAHVHIDMESLDSREATLALAGSVLAEEEFRAGPSAGVVLQAYLRDATEIAEQMLDLADRREAPLSIRLVKGAYWDHERIESTEHGWPEPVFATRRATDRNFEALTRTLLDARPRIRLAIGSHNIRSIAHALAYADGTAAGRDGLEFQVLRGLGDELAVAIHGCGARARVYTPVGDLIAGMAYLVRRLLENTSNDSFLVTRGRTADLETLLERP